MSFISRVMRPDGVTPLSGEDIRRLAPYALATGAHGSRSARYAYIPTAEVIRAMRANGFLPMAAAQARARDAGRAGHAKHMLRFRRADARPLAEGRVGQTFPEIVLLNSHDGTSAYRVMSGVFRLICLNGMVVADRRGAEVRVPPLDAAEAWQGIILSRDEQRASGEAAHLLRFGDAAGNAATPITPERLLAPRPAEDAGDDLWRVSNRVQENAVRGGLTARGRDAQGRPRRVTSRAVTGIEGDVRLNRALWQFAERMAEIKGGA